jgi:tRNA-uridine 2-sulfurtransferase
MDKLSSIQPQRIVIGMSGGVDSSVAAWLLKQQGHDVVGLFMKNWEADDDDEYCSSRQDWLDAASVADLLGIDIEAVNFSQEYKDRVFDAFLQEHRAGRTPNPDVLCNAEIKFKAFLDYAMAMGAERIATGHYARVRRHAVDLDRFELLKGLDPNKDQSYFLHRLSQAQLSKALFPLGELPKTEVRQIASRLGLPNASKKDSTGICFIGERPFRAFLNQYLPTEPGAILTPEGVQVGQHEGLSFYTLGQRKGLGIGGVKQYQLSDGSGPSWYVARKDMKNNILYVVPEHDHPWLLSSQLHAESASWISGEPPTPEHPYGVKARYRQEDAWATFQASQSQSSSSFTLDFELAQWAVTPGQSAVLYDGDVCLGGGIITEPVGD